MENEFVSALSSCPWVQNARLLAKPETSVSIHTHLNDTICFTYMEGNDKSEIQPLVEGTMKKIDYSLLPTEVDFTTEGKGAEALYAGVFQRSDSKVRLAITWLEEENRLAVIHITHLP